MKILVIEDDIDLTKTIRDALYRYHAVDLAHTGLRGIQQAKLGSYDVIILDLTLPDMDGADVCQKLRTGDDAVVPILVLTARDSVEDKVEALDAGADDYLTKPFSFDELLARLRALSRRSTQMAQLSNVLTVGDLQLDTSTRAVTRGKTAIDLRRKEFNLLEYMMRNEGLVLTRNMILDHVWEDDIDPTSNTVDVHINYLREKIDRPFKKALIKTVPGVGYTLKA